MCQNSDFLDFMKHRRKSPLLRGSHHDFNQYVWPPQRSPDADAYWRISSIHPLVPNGVVILKVPHIRQPHVGGQELRFVSAGFLQKLIDALKHLVGLYLYITDRIGGHTAKTNDAVVHDGKADDWEYFHSKDVLHTLACPNPLNGHLLVSCYQKELVYPPLLSALIVQRAG